VRGKRKAEDGRREALKTGGLAAKNAMGIIKLILVVGRLGCFQPCIPPASQFSFGKVFSNRGHPHLKIRPILLILVLLEWLHGS